MERHIESLPALITIQCDSGVFKRPAVSSRQMEPEGLEDCYVLPPLLGMTSPNEEIHLELIPRPDPRGEQPEETVETRFDHNGNILDLLTDNIEDEFLIVTDENESSIDFEISL